MEILGLVDIPTWLFWLFQVVALISLYTVYMCWDYGIFKKMGIKYPKLTPILGNFATVLEKGIVDAQNEMYYKYDKLWGITFEKSSIVGKKSVSLMYDAEKLVLARCTRSFETCYPVFNIGKPELIKDVFVKEFNHFVNRRTFDNSDEPLASIITIIKDDQWKHVRKVITPTFSGKKLREMVALINGAADRLIENVGPKVDKDEDIEIKETCYGYTMDVISCTAFGMQVDGQKNPNDSFVQAAKGAFDPNSFGFKYAMFVAFFCPFMLPVLKFLGLPRGFSKSLTYFWKNVTEEALAERRKNPNSHADFLELMVQAEKDAAESKDSDSTSRKGLTFNEILAQALFFFLAGSDTTATPLAYTMYQFSKNPECMEKAVEEVDTVLGNELPDYENCKKLTYIDMCFSEALRLFPPVPRVDRIAADDVVIGGIKIPKGMCVAIPVSAIHKDPEYWLEPDKFDPERFTQEEKAKRDQFVYMPFGHGPRNCVGMRLALLESKIAIARILQNFTICKSEKTNEPVKANKLGQLRVEGGLWVKMKRRKD